MTRPLALCDKCIRCSRSPRRRVHESELPLQPRRRHHELVGNKLAEIHVLPTDRDVDDESMRPAGCQKPRDRIRRAMPRRVAVYLNWGINRPRDRPRHQLRKN
jgi:hypothetical protein